jgi:hypothetical protein
VRTILTRRTLTTRAPHGLINRSTPPAHTDPAGTVSFGPRTKPAPVRARPILDPAWSAATRQQLLTEIAALGSSEEAARWARKGLEAKNSLTSEDAQIVEEAFALRLTGIGESEDEDRKEAQEQGRDGREGEEGEGGEGGERGQDGRDGREGRHESQQGQSLREERQGVQEARGGQESSPSPTAEDLQGPKAPRTIASIDKSILALSEPRRYRNKEHRYFVCSQPCLVCGRTPSDAHHVGFAQPRAFGLKVSDEFTVPLCRAHHRALHRAGQEAAWWKEVGRTGKRHPVSG